MKTTGNHGQPAKCFREQAGFTMPEFMIASTLTLLAAATVLVFIQTFGISLVNVSIQSSFNQSAGHAAEVIQRRIRMANTATTDSAGEVLTLSFDDDPLTDSDGDTVVWNDRDHFERFDYRDNDRDSRTLADNTLTWNPKVGTAEPTPLIPGSVRKLTGLNVFAVTNEATVFVNFGVLATNASANSQRIEIRTQCRLRNRIQ